MASTPPAELPLAILDDAGPGGRPDSSRHAEQAVRDLGRRSFGGVIAQAATMAFLELQMGGADGLPRGLVLTIFTCFLVLRFAGAYATSRQRGSLRLRTAMLAIGSIGAFLVWGVKGAAVLHRFGATKESIVFEFVMTGVATGAVAAFAPSRWIQRASLAVMILPVVILGIAGDVEPSFAVIQAVFLLYMLGQGRVACRGYWQSVHSAELLRRHAESAQRAAISAAAMNLQLRTEMAHSAQMEIELRQAQRLESIGRLAAGIAHEINNPLAYVTGNLEVVAEVLEAGTDSSSASAEHAELSAAIRDARDGAERVRKIVQGLKLFSRSEKEKRVPLALSDVIGAAVRMTDNEVRHRAQLVRELGPAPLVIADEGRLTQVFINLLVNAAHAIPEGRSDHNRITVRTRTDDQGWAVIEIEDSGKGIPADVQAHVFDPFFTTKDVGAGTGLGLSICHGIIRGLGGQIALESHMERTGDERHGKLPAGAPDPVTVVRVVLPPAGDAPVVAPIAASPIAVEAPHEAAPQRRHRVLLVDDEPHVTQTIKRLLLRDYDVTIAERGQEAIEHLARGTRFDAIVSDVMMPNMTGIDLFEEIQRIAPDQAQRLIFLSGGAFTAQTRARLGALDVPQLEKPVTANELRACVKRVATAGTPVVTAPPPRGDT